jgi:RHS repeat-associated protein
VYDAFGEATLSVDPLGRGTAWVYDGDGEVTEEVDGFGSGTPRATVTTYDSLGRVTATTAGYGTADAATSTTVYDDQGNATLTTDPLGRQTAYLYDADNEVTGTIAGFQLGSGAWRLTGTGYDGFGEAVSTTDPTGLTLLSTFDADGRVTATTAEARDALGVLRDRTTTSFLDAYGNVTLSVDALGRRSAATFDADDEELTATDGTAHPETTTSAYDAFGNVTLTVDPLGHATATSYDYDDDPVLVTAGMDLAPGSRETTRTAFDAFDEATLTVDPVGDEEEFTFDGDGEETGAVTGYGSGHAESESELYDAEGEETGMVDAVGDVTAVAFDNLGREIARIVGYGTAAAEEEDTEYDADSEVTGTVDGTGGTATLTRSFYDGFGAVTGTVDGAGRAVAMLYDLAGQPTAMIDAPGTAAAVTTLTATDGFGEETATTDGDGRTSSELTDADGEVTVSYDPAGHATHDYYDEFGQVTLTVDPAGHATATYYDDDGQVTLSVAGYGTAAATPEYTSYDELGRVARTTDGDGRVVASFYDVDDQVTLSVAGYGTAAATPEYTSYDANGNVTATTDGLGDTTTTVYDELNRPVTVTDPSGRVTHSYYDAAGNLTGMADGLGHLTQQLFDNQGREIESIDPDGHATHLYYDGDGNQTGELDPDSNLTHYLYNAAGEQTGVIDPDGHASHEYYDGAGLVTLTVDRDGRGIASYYDAARNLTATVWTDSGGTPDGGDTYTYDAAGEMLTATNGAGTYTLTYDGAGRVATVAGPFGVNLSFGYDGGGNRNVVTDGSGAETDSTFNAADELSARQLSTPGADSVLVDYGYDAAGRETSRTRWESATGGGWTAAGATDTSYDAGGLVTGMTTLDRSDDALWDAGYQYDTVGWLSTATVDGTSTEYGYDAAGQLVTAGVDTYGYDPNGVPNANGLTPGSNNQVSTDGLWTYTYDDAGELTGKTQGTGAPTWTYAYDNAGHMTQAAYSATGGAPTLTVDYTYDVFGNLVGRTETDSGTVTSDVRYAVDGWDTAKPDPTGNENYDDYADLVPDGSGGWAIDTRRAFGAGFDEPLAAVTTAGAVTWYGADRQGSVVAAFDTDGTVLASAGYDAFGTITSGGLADRYGFQGGRWDSVTGLEGFGDRMLNPVTQQWASEDPLGLEPDSDPRRFVGNQPTNAADPSGLQPTPERAPGQGGSASGSAQVVLTSLNAELRQTNEDLNRLDRELKAAMDRLRLNPNTNRWLSSTGRITIHHLQMVQEHAGNEPEAQAIVRLEEVIRRANEARLDIYKNIDVAIGQLDDASVAQLGRQGNTAARAEMIRRNLSFPETAEERQAREVYLREMDAIRRQRDREEAAAAQRAPLMAAAEMARFGLELTPVLGQMMAAYELTTGKSVLGQPLSTRDMALAGGALALPVLGPVVRRTAALLRTTRRGETVARELEAAAEAVRTARTPQEARAATTRFEQAALASRRALEIIHQATCFAAGTTIITPEGARPIEQVRPGDTVLSRDEYGPDGPVAVKAVEEVFVRFGQVWEMRVNGQTIRTTGEHPFFARDRNWVQTSELLPGDTLLTLDQRWIPVESVVNTERYETVYNLRVAEYRTYFVGGECGFGIWVHNACNHLIEELGTEAATRAFKNNPRAIRDAVEHATTGDRAAFERVLAADGIQDPATIQRLWDAAGKPLDMIAGEVARVGPGSRLRVTRGLEDLGDPVGSVRITHPTGDDVLIFVGPGGAARIEVMYVNSRGTHSELLNAAIEQAKQKGARSLIYNSGPLNDRSGPLLTAYYDANRPFLGGSLLRKVSDNPLVYESDLSALLGR